MAQDGLIERFVETGRGRIFYYLTPKINGQPTVVYLHGLSANHTTWLKPAETLAAHGFNNILLDMRGHGNSDKTRRRRLYRVEALKDDLDRILGQEGVQNPLVVGYSYGGAVALEHALTGRARPGGLVLISANHTCPLRYWGLALLIPAARGLVILLGYLAWWQKRREYLYYRPNLSGGYWQSVGQGLMTMPWSVNMWLLAQMGRIDYRGQLGAVGVPVLLAHSRHDPFVTAAETADMRNGFPQAEEYISKNESHFIASAAQDETAALILEFARKVCA